MAILIFLHRRRLSLLVYLKYIIVVQYHGTRIHLGLGFWLNSVAHGPNLFLPKTLTQTHTSYRPKLRIAQKPGEWTVNISTRLVSPPSSCSANHSRAIRKMFRHAIPCIPGNALGSIAVRHICWNGNQFHCHTHHAPLPPKHPLTTNDIRPLIALTMEVIIVSPLISRYKYEKLKEEIGCWKAHKEVGKGEKIQQSRGRGNFVESLCQGRLKVGNSSPQYK